MIVKNEEANLENCLRPIAHLFDEIVIVDTGSTDRTREIAFQFTDIVPDFPWCDDFSAARNETLRHAQGDWIFWLDADDRIPEHQIKKLAQLLKGLGHARHAYRMTTVCRSQYECDGVKHLSHFRLFRRDPRIQWQGRVHEQLRPEFRDLGFDIRDHPLRIEHGGYADGPLNLKKAQRDIRLLRLDFATDPESPSTIMHLAMAYARVSNYAEARKHLQILIDRETPQQKDWLSRAYELLIEISMKMGDLPGSLVVSERAVSAFPQEVSLLFERAQVLFEVDNYKTCADLLMYIRKLPAPRVSYGGKGQIQSKWVPILLADCWRHLGKYKQAIELLEKTIPKHPNEVRMLYSLGCCYLADGQRKSIENLRKKMEPVPQGGVFSLLLYIQDRLHHRELDKLDEWFEKLIHLAPAMPYPRLLRLEYLRQTDVKLVDYLAACRDAQRLNPHNSVLQDQITKIETFLAEKSPPQTTSDLR
jgi:glycosyltransferase involved in cell wall biosynthesis